MNVENIDDANISNKARRNSSEKKISSEQRSI